jgi:hypothetical protein
LPLRSRILGGDRECTAQYQDHAEQGDADFPGTCLHGVLLAFSVCKTGGCLETVGFSSPDTTILRILRWATLRRELGSGQEVDKIGP